MESMVDSIDSAYQEFVEELTAFMEAKQNCTTNNADRVISVNSCLQRLMQKWESFKKACDSAEEFVFTEKQRIACKCAIDAAVAESIGRDFVEEKNDAAGDQSVEKVENDSASEKDEYKVEEEEDGVDSKIIEDLNEMS